MAIITNGISISGLDEMDALVLTTALEDYVDGDRASSDGIARMKRILTSMKRILYITD